LTVYLAIPQGLGQLEKRPTEFLIAEEEEAIERSII
jgi:hypothetical protein